MPTSEFQAKLAAAASGSTLTALTMTPFDVVKTRLQTQRPIQVRPRSSPAACCQPPNVQCVRQMSSFARSFSPEQIVCVWDRGVFRTERVSGFSDAVRHVWRAEGIRGLWKGVGTTLLIGVPSNASYMLTYDYLLNAVLPPLLPPSVVPLFSGILARSTISTIVSPLELIRTNLQSTPTHAENPNTLRSVLTSIRGLAQQHGARFLWRGVGATLWRDVPFSGIYWAGYETSKNAFRQRGHTGAWVAFICGAGSGMSAALFTNPFDVLKTRRQALIMASATSTQNSSIALLRRILQKEGASALFAGLLPRVSKIAPACGIMIASYEGLGKFLLKT
ncbi:putative mitochondrial carrier protein [Mycena kentingensis (nom. inval.)]|nr:putative mitochondrial carrier protein [Mycena kentingensis (nom. inval.)]